MFIAVYGCYLQAMGENVGFIICDTTDLFISSYEILARVKQGTSHILFGFRLILNLNLLDEVSQPSKKNK